MSGDSSISNNSLVAKSNEALLLDSIYTAVSGEP